MQMYVEDRDDHTLIALSGRFDWDANNDHEMRFSAQTAAQAGNVIVDLSDLEMIFSLAIGLILSSAKAVQLRGGKMVLLGADGAVLDSLRTVGMHKTVPMVDTTDEALLIFQDEE